MNDIKKIAKLSPSELSNSLHSFGIFNSISNDYIVVSSIGSLNNVYLYKNKYLELQSNFKYLNLFSRIENDKIILNTENKNKFQDLPTQIPEDQMSNDPPNKNNEWLLETIIDLRKYNMDGSDISNASIASNYNIINACIFKKNKINIMISSLHNNIPTFHILEYNDNIIELSNIIELDASFSFSPNLASICISDNFASFILNKTYPNNLSNTYNTTVLFIYMKKDNKWDKIKEIPNEIFNDSIALSENNLIVGYNNYLVNNMPSVGVVYNLVNLKNQPFQLVPLNYNNINRCTKVSISKYTAVVCIEMKKYNKEEPSIIIFKYNEKKWNQVNVLYSNNMYDSCIAVICNNYILTRELVHNKVTNSFNTFISLYNKKKDNESKTQYQLIHTINQNSSIIDNTLYLFGISMDISNKTFIIGVPNIYNTIEKDIKSMDNGYVYVYNIEL